MLHTAVYSGKEAMQAKLVDSLEHRREAREQIRDNYFTKNDLTERSERLSLPHRVTVITAEGDILDRKFRLLAVGGHATVTPERMDAHFKQALGDWRTKAIVFRVSSPGGEVLASDEIAAMVEEANARKPVFISMGDVAASGGYMISAPGTKIFAKKLTITGSIGVFLGKFNLAGLFEKLDLHKQILGTAPYPGLYSEDRPWTEEERKVMLRRLNTYYESFVGDVAHYRSLSGPEAESAAKGRVWLGERAKALHLVDADGGLYETVAAAAERVGLREGDYEVNAIEDEAPLFSLFGEDYGVKAELRELAAGLLSPDAARTLERMGAMARNPLMYLSPVVRFE
jgi:protease-4